MYFEEHKITLLVNTIAEPNTYFTSQDIHFSGSGHIFTLSRIFEPFTKALGQEHLENQNVFWGFI